MRLPSESCETPPKAVEKFLSGITLEKSSEPFLANDEHQTELLLAYRLPQFDSVPERCVVGLKDGAHKLDSMR